MTRVNLIPPSELTPKHLVAEYVEIPRVYYGVEKAEVRGETPSDILKRAPATFVLGKGHVMFFYTRLAWVNQRYLLLVEEMLRRGYNPSFRELPPRVETLARHWFGEWSPSDDEIAISRARIEDRVKNPLAWQNKPSTAGKPVRNEWDIL